MIFNQTTQNPIVSPRQKKPEWLYKDLVLIGKIMSQDIIVKDAIKIMKEMREEIATPLEYEEFLPITAADILSVPHNQPEASPGITRIRSYLANSLAGIFNLPEEFLADYETFKSGAHHLAGMRYDSYYSPYAGRYGEPAFFNHPIILFPLVHFFKGMVAGGYLHSCARHRSSSTAFGLRSEQDVDVYFRSFEDLEEGLTNFLDYLGFLNQNIFMDQKKLTLEINKVSSFAVSVNVKLAEMKNLPLQFIVAPMGEETFEEILTSFDHHGAMIGWTKEGFLMSPHAEEAVEDDLYLLSKIPLGFPARLRLRTFKYAARHCVMEKKQLSKLTNFLQKCFSQEYLDSERNQTLTIYGTPLHHGQLKDLHISCLYDLAVMAPDQEARDDIEALLYTTTPDPTEMPDLLKNMKWHLHSRTPGRNSEWLAQVSPKRTWRGAFGNQAEKFPSPYTDTTNGRFDYLLKKALG